MKDWIPFFQALIWPLFLLTLMVFLRGTVRRILDSIAERIHRGATIEAGPGGIKIGAVEAEADNRLVDSLPNAVYITHQAIRDSGLDSGGTEYFRLRIALDADDAALLDDIEKVLYHLHPTFQPADRTVSNRKSNFEIITSAWGEFNMTAEIFFRGGKPKLVVERYINLPGPI